MTFQQTFLKNPEAIAEHWQDAWNKKDAVGIANLFAEDAEFVNVVGLWWHNRKDIWKAHDYGFRVIFPDSTIELRKTTCQLLNSETALVHVRMKLTGQSHYKKNEKPGDRKNIFSFVLRREPQGWVAVSAHNTDIVPGKETNFIDESGALKSVDYRDAK